MIFSNDPLSACLASYSVYDLDLFTGLCSLLIMTTVSIGPHLMKNGLLGLLAPDLEHTGYSIELSGDEFVMNTGIYRRIYPWQPGKTQFSDFCVSEDEVPFPLLPVVRQIQEQSTSSGPLVSLEAVLASLYIRHEVKRPFTSFLTEVRDHLPVNHCYYPRIKYGSEMVDRALAELGFEVITFATYGRTLTVQLGWVFPQDRQNSDSGLNEFAGTVQYKPRPDRTLGEGKWLSPSEATVAYLFTDMLESMDQNHLLSGMGIQAAVDNFKWTRVSTLTNREARQARIDFVREHPELHGNPHVLAKALKRAELYSDSMEIYAIKKQVPRLIREAT